MATTSLNDWTFHKFNIFTHSNGAVEFDVDIQKNRFRWKSNRINSNPTIAMPEIANHKSMTENEKKQAFINMITRELSESHTRAEDRFPAKNTEYNDKNTE